MCRTIMCYRQIVWADMSRPVMCYRWADIVHDSLSRFVIADRAMQLNESRFSQNGGCGYVLQPSCMRHPDYDPFDKNTLVDIEMDTQ